MADRLLTDAEARERALELAAQFDRDPDVLSPDEQALVMTLRSILPRPEDLAWVCEMVKLEIRRQNAGNWCGTFAVQDLERIDRYQALWEAWLEEWERRGNTKTVPMPERFGG
jgi:hypothetical protein